MKKMDIGIVVAGRKTTIFFIYRQLLEYAKVSTYCRKEIEMSAGDL